MDFIKENWELIKETLKKEYSLSDISYTTWIAPLKYYNQKDFYEKYKDKSTHIIESNPYILIDDIEDINFKYADRIAERVGLDIDFHSRVEEGIRYVLKLYTLNGHVYMPMDKLYKNTSYVLGINNYEIIEDGIYTLVGEKGLKLSISAVLAGKKLNCLIKLILS